MHRPQVTRKILMMRPTTFGFNAQAARTNTYMHRPSASQKSLRDRALAEFDTMADILRATHIKIVVWDDVPEAPLPDAVFPNNWLSTWSDGTLFLYPMEPPSRRAERQPALIASLGPTKIIDLSPSEKHQQFLEGTGAIVFDHDNHIAYGALSPRCNERLFRAHAAQLGYRTVVFHTSHNGAPVYHTNVILSVLPGAAVICTEVIASETEKLAVLDTLQQSGRQIIDISADQMASFCGNMLAIANKNGDLFVVLSQTALKAFTPTQRSMLGKHAKLLPVDIPTIERIGGGSARCMLAEICL